MSHIIAVLNQKGGVGKTTTTINLAGADAAANTLLRYANTTTTLSVAVRNLRVSWIYLENDR